MVTANEGRRHQAYAESLGVDKYMLKPVPLERLLTAAVELLKARGPVARPQREDSVYEDDSEEEA
jgi:DNA-binding response OmpR family regulator